MTPSTVLSSTAWTTLKVCFCKWCEETHSCFYPGMLCHQTQKSSDLSTVAGGVLLGSAASNGFWLGLGPWVRRKFWRCFYFAFLGPEGENNIHRIHVVYDILYTVFIHHKRKFYKSVWELYLCVYIYICIYIYTHFWHTSDAALAAAAAEVNGCRELGITAW